MKYNKTLSLFVILFALSGCDFVNINSNSTTNEHSHNYKYKTTIIEPTCEKEGYTIYECDCGDTYTSDYTPSTGHNFGEWYTISDASCTENGTKRRDCENKNCDHYETDLIGKGHNFIDGVCNNCSEIGYAGIEFQCFDDGTATVVSKGTNVNLEVFLPSYYKGYKVTKIGDYAFSCNYEHSKYNTSSTLHIDIPETVIEIGNHAFDSCTPYENENLDVVLPSSLKIIGEYAFYGTSIGKDIIIPKSVDYIGESTFLYCQCDSISFEEGTFIERLPYQFISCNNLITEFTVPKSVKYIDSEAFRQNVKLENVYFENDSNCTFIGEYAFLGSKIKAITIPKSVKILDGTFNNCVELTEVIFEENSNLEIITSRTFDDCNNLKKVILPCNVDIIGNNNFLITPPNEDSYLIDNYDYNVYENGCYVGTEKNPYLYFVKPVSTDIESIVINDNARFIGNDAFKNCGFLKIINFGNSKFNKICGKMFADCFQLETVIFSPNIEMIEDPLFASTLKNVSFGENSKLKFIGAGAFEGTNIEEIFIPKTVKYIGEHAFSECDDISIVLENGIDLDFVDPDFINVIPQNSNIYCGGYYVGSEENPYLILLGWGYNEILDLKNTTEFYNFTGYSYGYGIFDNLNINAKNIYGLSFASNSTDPYLTSYKNIRYFGNEKNPYLLLIDINDMNVENIEIHPDCRIIGESSLDDLDTIEEVIIPKNVTAIQNGAFYYSNISNFKFENDSKIIIIDHHALPNNSNIYIPNSLKYLFYNEDFNSNIIFENDSKIEYIESITYSKVINFPISYDLNDVYDVYDSLTDIFDEIFYNGTYYDFIIACRGNIDSDILNKTFFYSEEKPKNDGKYWHYDSEGNPVKWE